MKRIDPPAPKFILFQIGDALIPRVDFETQLLYRSRDITDVLHGADGEFDYYRCRRSPLERGDLSHSGKYLEDCLTAADCGSAMHEWTKLRRVTGTYQPFIFYFNDPSPACPPASANTCGCPVVPHCGKWLWAYGKLLAVTNTAAIDDWTNPAVSQIDLEAKLETPLRELHFSQWRFGKAPVKQIAPCETLASAEQAMLRESSCFFAPCDVPAGCCGVDRWWYREPIECVSYDCRFNPVLWPLCDLYKFRAESGNTGCFVIDVDGSYRPETRWLIQPGSIVTIENFLGERTYNFPACNTPIYLDSATGEAKTILANGTLTDLDMACVIPSLEVGENRIIFYNDFELGVIPTWIN